MGSYPHHFNSLHLWTREDLLYTIFRKRLKVFNHLLSRSTSRNMPATSRTSATSAPSSSTTRLTSGATCVSTPARSRSPATCAARDSSGRTGWSSTRTRTRRSSRSWWTESKKEAIFCFLTFSFVFLVLLCFCSVWKKQNPRSIVEQQRFSTTLQRYQNNYSPTMNPMTAILLLECARFIEMNGNQ